MSTRFPYQNAYLVFQSYKVVLASFRLYFGNARGYYLRTGTHAGRIAQKNASPKWTSNGSAGLRTVDKTTGGDRLG